MRFQRSTFDPFSLLSSASTLTFGLELFKGAGDISTNQYGLDVSDQKLFFKYGKAEFPVSLAVRGEDSETFYHLVDGTTSYSTDGVDDAQWTKILSISRRDDLSNTPIALLDDTAFYHQVSPADIYDFSLLDYEPYVVLFSKKVETENGNIWIGGGGPGDEIEPTIIEKRREYITSENNDYWEGVFQYDINKDGTIPAYVPSEYPLTSKPGKNVDGKKIKGTKKDDTLKGTKKNDYINGKKGDDIIKGRTGDDVLLGKKGFDRLLGKKGDDHLNGGGGNDVLKGGKGADTFKLSKGSDTIVDFSVVQGDKIAIPEEFINSFEINGIIEELLVIIDDTLSDRKPVSAVISVEGYGELLLSGVDQSFVEQNNADIFVRYG